MRWGDVVLIDDSGVEDDGLPFYKNVQGPRTTRTTDRGPKLSQPAPVLALHSWGSCSNRLGPVTQGCGGSGRSTVFQR